MIFPNYRTKTSSSRTPRLFVITVSCDLHTMRRRVARVGNEVPRMTFLFFLPRRARLFLSARRGEQLVPAIYSRFEIPRLRPAAFSSDTHSPMRPSSDTRSKGYPCGTLNFQARIFENSTVESFRLSTRDSIFSVLNKTNLVRSVFLILLFP